MWLLLVIVISGTSVKQAEVYDIFDSEQECIKVQVEMSKSHPPEDVNLGCVPLRGYGRA
tara:strand:- start:1076 stop:1252 length:177 start_codon:yes stop_codon:yes gene_type:complete